VPRPVIVICRLIARIPLRRHGLDPGPSQSISRVPPGLSQKPSSLSMTPPRRPGLDGGDWGMGAAATGVGANSGFAMDNQGLTT
jgi:hypothetical protein